MKVTGLVISTLFTGDTNPIESRRNIDNVFADDAIVPTFEETFLLELTRNLIALKNEGAIVTIVPVIDYSDEDWSIWERLDNRSRHTVLTLLEEGRKIGAIKEVRTQTDLGLKEAKRFIDGEFIAKKVWHNPK